MKLQTALLAALLATPALAADLALTDGRVLKDATITSQTPRAVTVKHAAGLSSIAKALLPPELRAKYPLDETAALLGDQRAAQAKIAAQEFQQREAARAAEIRTSRNQQFEATHAASPTTEIDKIEFIRKQASTLALNYFNSLFNRHGEHVACTITIDEATPLENQPNRWRVTGHISMTLLPSAGGAAGNNQSDPNLPNQSTYSSSQPAFGQEDTSAIGDAAWRKYFNEQQTSQGGGPSFYTPPPPQTSHEQASTTPPPSKPGPRPFEGIYTDHDVKPTIKIKVL